MNFRWEYIVHCFKLVVNNKVHESIDVVLKVSSSESSSPGFWNLMQPEVVADMPLGEF